MAQTIKLKRSNVAGNIPSSSDLALGEIAVNTADGALYIKKGDNTIVAVGDNDILHIDTSNGRVGIGTTSPSADLTVSGTIANDAFTIPNSIGTAGQVLKAPSSGTTLTWADESGSSGAIAPSINTMTGDGSTTTLALSTTPVNENATIITFDGVLQHKSTYSLSGSTITFSTAPANGVAVECIVINTHSIQALEDGDSDTKIQVEETADEDKIRFDTAGTERMIIDASGNVGIGTSSPDQLLSVKGRISSDSNDSYYGAWLDGNSAASQDNFLGLGPWWNDAGYIKFFQSSSPHRLSIYTTNTGDHVTLQEAGGNVGIGTTTPSSKLHVSGSSNVEAKIESTDDNAILRISADSGGTGIGGNEDPFLIYQSGGSDVARIYHDNSAGALIFDNNSTTERMRIDSSGNLLVGTTTTTLTTNDGIQLSSDGFLHASRDGNIAGQFNRITSDGDIVRFRKDGTSVGTIGVIGSDVTIGNGDTGLRFIASIDAIAPATLSTPTNRDAAIDLGTSAVRFKDLYLSGNITVGGTVDGRDLATDGTKLDGIESGATADQTQSDINALAITQVGTISSGTWQGTAIASAYLDSDTAHLSGAQTFTGVKTFASPVINTGISGTAILDEDNMASNSATQLATQQSIKAYVDAEVAGIVDSAPGALDTLNELAAALGDDANFSTTVTNSIATKLPLAGGTLTGDLNFGDNDKAVFGTGSDLQIYHDGSNSIIKDAGTGILQIRASTNLQLQDADGYLYVNCIDGGNGGTTKLYNLNQEKLATTSTGIDVTGTATMDGLTVEGSSTGTLNIVNFLNTDTSSNQTANRLGLGISNSAGNNYTYIEAKEPGIDAYAEMNFYTGSTTTKRLTLGNGGDISFYEDTGTTAKLFWDASAERLGIGTTSPNYALQVHEPSDSTVRFQITNSNTGSGTADGFQIIQNGSSQSNKVNLLNYENSALGIWTNNTERLHITSSGNVGIGTTVPQKVLDVTDSSSGESIPVVISNKDTTAGTGQKVTLGFGLSRNSGAFKPEAGTIEVGREADWTASDSNIDSYMAFSTYLNNAATEKVRIDSSGKVGIGTTSPASTLDIKGDGAEIYLRSADYNVARIIPRGTGTNLDKGLLSLFDTGVENVRIDTEGNSWFNGGNVGIGTTSPSAILHSYKNSAEQGMFSGWSSVGANTSSGAIRLGANASYQGRIDYAADANTQFIFENTYASGIFNWKIAGSEKMRIDSSGNVGIGTSIAASKLHVYNGTSGTIATITGPNAYNAESGLAFSEGRAKISGFLNGSGATPGASLRFYTMPDNGSVTERLRIDSSGNVGIGNSTINTFYDTAVNVYGSGNSVIQFQSSNTGTASGDGFAVGVLNGAAADAYIWNRESSNLLFGTSSSEKMRIDSSGNVGIGTTSPSAKLHIESPSNARGIRLQNSLTNSASYVVFNSHDGTEDSFIGNEPSTVSTDTLILGTASTTAITIDGSQNVGIGTTSPARQVHLHDASGDNNLHITNNTTGATASDGFSIVSQSGSNNVILNQRESSNLIFHTGNVERARIDSSGNVGIGTTSPATRLHSVGSAGEVARIGSGSVAFSLGVGHSGNGTGYLNLFPTSSPSTSPTSLAFQMGGTERMRIDASGNVGIGTSSPAGNLHVKSIGNVGDALLIVEADADNNLESDNPRIELRQDNNFVTGAVYLEGNAGQTATNTLANSLILDAKASSAGSAIQFATGGLAASQPGGPTNSAVRMTIMDSGVGIGNTSPSAKLQVEEYGIDTTETSTTATTQVAIHTMSATTFRSARFTVQVTNSTDSTYHLTEILMIHDGTTPSITEYGTIFTGSAEATFDADISSGNVRLLATPASTDTMEFKVVAHSITT